MTRDEVKAQVQELLGEGFEVIEPDNNVPMLFLRLEVGASSSVSTVGDTNSKAINAAINMLRSVGELVRDEVTRFDQLRALIEGDIDADVDEESGL